MIESEKVFIKEAADIIQIFKGLNLIDKLGKFILAGELFLLDEDGIQIDVYSIEIHPSTIYPLRFPYVYEVGNRIPRNVDWHIFESDGHCCLKSQPEEMLICKKGITLHSFVISQVIPYFFNQAFREKHGYFLNERPHGLAGNLEYFFELFRTSNPRRLYDYMAFVSRNNEPSRREKCFCGSGEKYRRCHRNAYRTMSQFTSAEIYLFAQEVVRLFNC